MASPYPQSYDHGLIIQIGLSCLAGALNDHKATLIQHSDPGIRRAAAVMQLQYPLLDHINPLQNDYVLAGVQKTIQDLVSMVWIRGEQKHAELLVLDKRDEALGGEANQVAFGKNEKTGLALNMQIAYDVTKLQMITQFSFYFRVLKVYPDFEKVMSHKEYMEWHKSSRMAKP